MIDPVKLDVRTVERHIAAGRLERADYDKYLENLPDLAEEAEYVDYATTFREEERQAAAEAEAEAQAAESAPAEAEAAPAAPAPVTPSGEGPFLG